MSAQSQAVRGADICAVVHDIGNLHLSISNIGGYGNGTGLDYDETGSAFLTDCFTGRKVTHHSRFPKNSWVEYLYGGGIWVGGVLGVDTLVSTGWMWDFTGDRGREFRPDLSPDGDFQVLSKLSPDPLEREKAVSEQDFVTTYHDTISSPWASYIGRKPLNIKVLHKSYAWSYSFAEDFVIVDLTIENIGDRSLKGVYLGIHIEPLTVMIGSSGISPPINGFLKDISSSFGCGFVDTLNIAWSASSDGNPYKGEFISHVVREGDFVYTSAPHVLGTRILKSPGELMKMSYNWWGWDYGRRYDYGPRHRKDYYDFRTGGLGTPIGDKNQYHVMSNGEIDYEQAYTAVVSPDDEIWITPPRDVAIMYAGNYWTVSLLSYGPLQLDPGASTSLVFALVAGENFHTDVNNGDNLPYDPDAWYENVDFSDLAKNAMFAGWIYDNPGIDSDGDGYFGKSRICIFDSALTESGWVVSNAETAWYEGDGVPDWRAAGPPPAPVFWILPTRNGLTIRFNGSRSETEKDQMTGIVDFEGYHIWLGRDDRESSYSIVGGYDLENFDKFVWNERAQPYPNFDLFDNPFTIEQLRCLYGSGQDPCNDLTFKPRRFTRSDPYIHPQYSDSIFMFVPHNFNSSQLGDVGGVRKTYPDEPPPPRGMHPDSLGPERYTEDGYLKYYEYEFTIENLLPTVPYWVNVTVFDFGSAESGISPLESSKTVGAKSAFPFVSDNRLNGRSMEVYVYPNPYRINGNYRDNGYEGRTQEIMPDEKVRAIHFANLPPKCTISIFSIDGDLVREIHHDVDPSDPNHLHDEWNLVTRNRQAVVSGLYYWTVEDDAGNVQIGKLAIIM